MRTFNLVFRLIGVVILTICTLIIGYVIILNTWLSGGNYVNQPNQEILITAEQLYNNPLPTPYNIRLDTKNIYSNRQRICVSLLNVKNEGTYSWSRLFLNGERIPYEHLSKPLWLSNSDENMVILCLNPNPPDPPLSEGLHLLEVQFKSSPFYTDTSYQWAIKIEPTGTPTPSATPSAP